MVEVILHSTSIPDCPPVAYTQLLQVVNLPGSVKLGETLHEVDTSVSIVKLAVPMA